MNSIDQTMEDLKIALRNTQYHCNIALYEIEKLQIENLETKELHAFNEFLKEINKKAGEK